MTDENKFLSPEPRKEQLKHLQQGVLVRISGKDINTEELLDGVFIFHSYEASDETILVYTVEAGKKLWHLFPQAGFQGLETPPEPSTGGEPVGENLKEENVISPTDVVTLEMGNEMIDYLLRLSEANKLPDDTNKLAQLLSTKFKVKPEAISHIVDSLMQNLEARLLNQAESAKEEENKQAEEAAKQVAEEQRLAEKDKMDKLHWSDLADEALGFMINRLVQGNTLLPAEDIKAAFKKEFKLTDKGAEKLYGLVRDMAVKPEAEEKRLAEEAQKKAAEQKEREIIEDLVESLVKDAFDFVSNEVDLSKLKNEANDDIDNPKLRDILKAKYVDRQLSRTASILLTKRVKALLIAQEKIKKVKKATTVADDRNAEESIPAETASPEKIEQQPAAEEKNPAPPAEVIEETPLAPEDVVPETETQIPIDEDLALIKEATAFLRENQADLKKEGKNKIDQKKAVQALKKKFDLTGDEATKLMKKIRDERKAAKVAVKPEAIAKPSVPAAVLPTEPVQPPAPSTAVSESAEITIEELEVKYLKPASEKVKQLLVAFSPEINKEYSRGMGNVDLIEMLQREFLLAEKTAEELFNLLIAKGVLVGKEYNFFYAPVRLTEEDIENQKQAEVEKSKRAETLQIESELITKYLESARNDLQPTFNGHDPFVGLDYSIPQSEADLLKFIRDNYSLEAEQAKLLLDVLVKKNVLLTKNGSYFHRAYTYTADEMSPKRLEKQKNVAAEQKKESQALEETVEKTKELEIEKKVAFFQPEIDDSNLVNTIERLEHFYPGLEVPLRFKSDKQPSYTGWAQFIEEYADIYYFRFWEPMVGIYRRLAIPKDEVVAAVNFKEIPAERTRRPVRTIEVEDELGIITNKPEFYTYKDINVGDVVTLDFFYPVAFGTKLTGRFQVQYIDKIDKQAVQIKEIPANDQAKKTDLKIYTVPIEAIYQNVTKDEEEKKKKLKEQEPEEIVLAKIDEKIKELLARWQKNYTALAGMSQEKYDKIATEYNRDTTRADANDAFVEFEKAKHELSELQAELWGKYVATTCDLPSARDSYLDFLVVAEKKIAPDQETGKKLQQELGKAERKYRGLINEHVYFQYKSAELLYLSAFNPVPDTAELPVPKYEMDIAEKKKIMLGFILEESIQLENTKIDKKLAEAYGLRETISAGVANFAKIYRNFSSDVKVATGLWLFLGASAKPLVESFFVGHGLPPGLAMKILAGVAGAMTSEALTKKSQEKGEKNELERKAVDLEKYLDVKNLQLDREVLLLESERRVMRSNRRWFGMITGAVAATFYGPSTEFIGPAWQVTKDLYNFVASTPIIKAAVLGTIGLPIVIGGGGYLLEKGDEFFKKRYQKKIKKSVNRLTNQ